MKFRQTLSNAPAVYDLTMVPRVFRPLRKTMIFAADLLLAGCHLWRHQ